MKRGDGISTVRVATAGVAKDCGCPSAITAINDRVDNMERVAVEFEMVGDAPQPPPSGAGAAGEHADHDLRWVRR